MHINRERCSYTCRAPDDRVVAAVLDAEREFGLLRPRLTSIKL